jgi:hypothetical protein
MSESFPRQVIISEKALKFRTIHTYEAYGFIGSLPQACIDAFQSEEDKYSALLQLLKDTGILLSHLYERGDFL